MAFFSKKKETTDRRKYERLGYIIVVRCKRLNSGAEFKIYSNNISMDGMKFLTTEKLLKGDILELNILLQIVKSDFKAKGQVVWVKPHGDHQSEGGIEVIEISEEDRKKYLKFIEKYKIDVQSYGDREL